MNYPPTRPYDGANEQADPLLDFETDSDTHFQCPQCGQKGSVPTAALEQALSETPHVHISCSSCAHKFEPFADLQEADMQEAGLETGANDGPAAATAKVDTEADPVSALVPPLDDHWQQGDEAQDAPAEDNPADNREGDPEEENDTAPESSLPSWMMAELKPAPETKPEDAAADAEIIADLSNPPALEDDVAEDDGAEDDVTEGDEAEDDTVEDEIVEDDAAADETIEAAPVNAEAEASQADEADTEFELDAAARVDADAALDEAPFEDGDELYALDADALLGATDAGHAADESAPDSDAPDMLDMAERLNIEEVPYSPPARSGPIGVVNGILLLVVLLLTGLNSYVLLQDEPQIREIFTAAPLATASIGVQTADFERFSDADGDSVEIAVRFINSGEKAGIIGDFRIDLQDSARQTLVSWTVLSSGETVAPGQSRTVNSTLFGPPAGLAHVAIAYPLDD